MSTDEQTCYASSIVEVIGLRQLQSINTPEELHAQNANDPSDLGIEFTPEQGDRFFDSFGECADIEDLLVDEFVASENLHADTLSCIRRGLNERVLRRPAIALFTRGLNATRDDPDLMGPLLSAMSPCYQQSS